MGVRRRPPPPAGRERFLQSLLSAKGARRRPRERSSAGASGGLLPAGSGKADAVWNSTRQTATTSHNFILESLPAAAPAPAGERMGERTLGLVAALGMASLRVLAPGPNSAPPSTQAAAAQRNPGHPRPLPSPLQVHLPRAPQARLSLGVQPQLPFSFATRYQGVRSLTRAAAPASPTTTTPGFLTSPQYWCAKSTLGDDREAPSLCPPPQPETPPPRPAGPIAS